jgi:hypothetical protein
MQKEIPGRLFEYGYLRYFDRKTDNNDQSHPDGNNVFPGFQEDSKRLRAKICLVFKIHKMNEIYVNRL